MRWRKISEHDVHSTLESPDRIKKRGKNRYNAFKSIKNRLLKVTYTVEEDTKFIITAVWKGE
jgi:DNA-binding ferritin-like protein (Dps family)